MTRRASRLPAIPDRLAALVDDRLTGARCAGKSPAFDAELDHETAEQRSARLAWATRQCRQCPVQGQCHIAAREQDHPLGVWAGHVHGLPGRPKAGAA
ncbi:WhiB family transcriptional regulator [Rhodococcus pyridinivorans]